MKIALTSPVAHGIGIYSEVDVRLPGPGVDLARPPKGMTRLAWHISSISDLPADAVRELSELDAHAILDGYSGVLAEVGTFTRALTAAHHAMKG